MSAKRSPTITEAEWRTAMEADFVAARTPPKPPPGYFDFPTWRRLLGLGRTATKNKLEAMLEVGVVERITHPAFDSLGRVTPRQFWRKKGKAKQ